MTRDDVVDLVQMRNYVNDRHSAVVVLPLADLDMAFAYKFQDYLTDLIQSMEPLQELYVDLSNVSYIPSLGVGALSSALVAAMKKRIPFYVCNIKPKVRSVFDMLGLMPYFTEKKPDV